LLDIRLRLTILYIRDITYVPCFVILQSLTKVLMTWLRRGWSKESRWERFWTMKEVKVGRSRLQWESCTSSSNLYFKVCLSLESMDEQVQEKKRCGSEKTSVIYIATLLSKFPSQKLIIHNLLLIFLYLSFLILSSLTYHLLSIYYEISIIAFIIFS